MKKILSVIFLMICSWTLFGCSDNTDDVVELKSALGTIQEQLSMLDEYNLQLEDTIVELENTIEKLNKQVDTDKSIIYALRDKIEETKKELAKTKEEMKALDISVVVNLAEEYYLVVGETFQLFYRSVIQCVDPYGYYVKLTGKVGHQYNRYYEFTPDTAGSYKLKLEVCTSSGVVCGSDETTLIVSPKDAPTNHKNILCIGDSLTASGNWTAQGYKKYVQAGGNNITLLGTKKSTIDSVTVSHEGYGGWQWLTFISGDGSIKSPFYSESKVGDISFIDYCTRNNYSGIDEVYILLTWNGVGGANRTFSFEDNIGSNAKKFIDRLHQDYPNCKISIMSIPLPSVNAGLGAYYTINQSYGDNYGQLLTAHNYNNFLEDWCNDEKYSSFMRYIDVKGQFDSEFNMPSENKPVNKENQTSEKIGNSMGMHPSISGYKQIGDVFYTALLTKWE